MFDWLLENESAGLDAGPMVIAGRLVMSAVAGVIIAAIAHLAYGRRKENANGLTTTLVLLAVLLAMVTLVIGNSVARAFGLVGALSIVRFRTVVDDTRDTAFVIFAVIVGMAMGAGVWLVPAIGIPLVGLLAIGMDRQQLVHSVKPETHLLTVRLGLGRDAETLLRPYLDQYFLQWKITSSGTARQGAAIEIVFSVTLRDGSNYMRLPELIGQLNRIEGIQAAEIGMREI